MGEGEQLTFKKRDGEAATVTLKQDDSLLEIRCPVDGTQLIQTIGVEDYFISCPNCHRTYYCGNHPTTCSQESVNRQYQAEIERTRQKLQRLRKSSGDEESRLKHTLEELENPFSQR
jgi:uncharacterized Zn finger protein (UPF0148 family)